MLLHEVTTAIHEESRTLPLNLSVEEKSDCFLDAQSVSGNYPIENE
jgi:hypothetical protein